MKSLISFLKSCDIDGVDSCWNWKLGKDRDGYGRVVFLGKSVGAHRLAAHYFLHFDLSPDLYVLHKCDNPSCCNPLHLFVGTQKDNAVDMAKKKRGHNQYADRTHCPYGHEYTLENTYLRKKNRGVFGISYERHCRACKKRRNSRILLSLSKIGL